jgi:hypothetical protein
MTRKSKREIAQQLEELEVGPADEYPHASLADIWRFEWKAIDKGRRLYQKESTGEVYFIPDFDLEG